MSSRKRSSDRDFRPLAGQRDQDFMDSFIPEPTHPRHTARIAATGVLALFFAAVAWTAFVAPTHDYAGAIQGLGWTVLPDGVSWGSESYRSHWNSNGGNGGGSSNVEAISSSTVSEWSGKKVEWDVKDMQAFDKATVARVRRELADGTLFSYEWHASLQGWNASVQNDATVVKRADGYDGRLIVLGDVHGMEASLKALLKRLAYDQTKDTLLMVGDLVAKSTVDTSLETVALLRQLGARGVRGNHDQGVIQWRRWMEAYGPGKLATQSESGEDGIRQYGNDMLTSTGSDGSATEVPTDAEDSKALKKRGWWPFGGNDSPVETIAEEYTEDDEVEFGVDNVDANSDSTQKQDEAGETGQAGSNREDTTDINEPLSEVEKSKEAQDSSITNSEASPSSTTTSGFQETASADAGTPTTTSSRRPWNRPVVGSEDDDSKTSETSTDSSNTATSSAYDGSLTGPEWTWLTVTERKLRKLNVRVPRKWEWGGEWFEIARRMPREDFEYLAQMPLTLHLEGLETYLVHAGMLPWTDVKAAIESAGRATGSSTGSSKPALLQSESGLAFQPDSSTTRQLASSPSRSLLLLSHNTQPFTLLNMRTLKFGDKPSSKSHGDIGGEGALEDMITVSKGKKGTPWMDEWNRGMRECAEFSRDGQSCVPQNVVFGHWAGRGLDVAKYSLGLDSACVAGQRLSALVLYKNVNPDDDDHVSPLQAQSGSKDDLVTLSALESSSGAFRKFPAGGIPSSHRPNNNPWGDMGGIRKDDAPVEPRDVSKRVRRVVRFGRRAPPLVRPEIDVSQMEDAMKEQYQEAKEAEEAAAAASAEQEPATDSEPQDVDTAAEDAQGQAERPDEVGQVQDEEARVELDESAFSEQKIEFAGRTRGSWIVSVDCANEASALGLS